MNTPPDDFEERARAAGRELRQAAPADGLRRIQTARRNRRALQGTGALAVAVLGVGAIVAVANRGDDETIVTTEPTVPAPTTVPDAPTVTTAAPVVEPVETTVPPTTPVTTPTTTPDTAPTSTSTTTSTTTTTAAPVTPIVQSVWVGQKLAGWYADGRFVPYDFGAALPDGLLGTPIDLVGGGGAVAHTAMPTDADCSSPYLDPSPGSWGIFATPGAPLATAPLALRPAAGVELPDGFEAGQVRVADLPGENLSGDAPQLVLVDGWNATYQTPTWYTLFDPVLGAFTTIEGDADPANALDLGQPANVFLDIDLDGNWEIAFAVGDGWGIRELLTGDTIVFGANHPCPEFIP